jgi:hypothetical protein
MAISSTIIGGEPGTIPVINGTIYSDMLYGTGGSAEI